MTTVEKVQLVIDIANNRRPVGDLQLAIDDSTDNFIKTAIDHCVATCAKGSGPQFRFRIVEGRNESFTEWQAEHNQFTTSVAMGQLRLAHPQAAISIQRQYS